MTATTLHPTRPTSSIGATLRPEPAARGLRAPRRTDFAAASTSRAPRQPRRSGPREFSHRADEQQIPRSIDAPRVPVQLDDPTALCCAVAHAAMESLRGVRPLAQLARSVSPEVFDALHARAQVRASARRGVAPTAPVLASSSRVRRARVVRIAPGIAEATVIVDDVDRVRAAALRVEEHRGRWRVVVLEIG